MAEIIPLKKRPAKTWEPVYDAKGAKLSGFLRHVSSQVIYFRKKFARMGIPPLFVTTGETTLGRARTKADLLRQQHVNKYLGVDDSHAILKKKDFTFGEVARETLEKYTPEKRPKTIIQHKCYIPKLIREFDKVDINVITDEIFQAYIAKCRRTERRLTFDDYAKHMNVVLHFAYRQKYVMHRVKFRNPDRLLRNKIQNKLKSRKPLTADEKEILELKKARILTRAERDKLWPQMNCTLQDQFVLSLECMMRLREVLHLEWDRINLETGAIKLRDIDVKTGSATGKGRAFIASPHALQRLRARWTRQQKRAQKNSPFVFPGRGPLGMNQPQNENQSAWRKAKEDANIEGFKWHWLRHTGLTLALLGDPELPPEERKAQRKNPFDVSLYAGVSLKVIRDVYLHADAEATRDVSENSFISL